jgi:hypothetical protein
MNRLFALVFLIALGFATTSCDKEIDINDDYQDIAIVYGLINPNDSISYLRIEKAYLSNGDIYQDAQIADSNLFRNKLDVKVYSNNRIITFDTITIYNKKEGIFYAPKMVVYYAVTKGLLNTLDTYNLEIKNPETGQVITSSTSLIDGSSIRFEYPNQTITFESDKQVAFTSIPNARLYQLNLRFHYTEGLISGSDTTFSEHAVDWIFPGITSRDLTGGEELLIDYIGEQFYSNLLLNIPYKERVVRMIGQCEVIVSVADETFNVYMEVNKPSASIVIDRPAFTNIENGYGLFASRSKGGGMYSLNNFTKNRLKTFEQMNFIR